MTTLRADVAVLGSGFGGSLCAMLAARIGLRPVLIERGAHPRFAIGESATPVANLVLARLAEGYGLPRLRPLSKYGTWREAYPNLPCGLKRGFGYVHHRPGAAFRAHDDHRNELLVGANPDVPRGDTQWFRSELDAFLVREAQGLGVAYLDRTVLDRLDPGPPWRLAGVRGEEAVDIEADFLIDATGPAGAVGQALGIEADVQGPACHSRAVYGHFDAVRPWAGLYEAGGGRATDHPFPCDRATLHHVFDGGWMWIIRFDNGLTSAGFVLDRNGECGGEAVAPEREWRALCARFPSIAAQFAGARAVRPLCGTGRLQRRWRRTAGNNWAMLPHTAYFVDPLHSPGIAHNLLGVARVIAILKRSETRAERTRALEAYHDRLSQEIRLIDRIVHGSYLTFATFELFAVYVMTYFLAATGMEQRLRAGTAIEDAGFLLADDPGFRRLVEQAHGEVRRMRSGPEVGDDELRRFVAVFARSAAPFNVAGLCDPGKRNMYPFA